MIEARRRQLLAPVLTVVVVAAVTGSVVLLSRDHSSATPTARTPSGRVPTGRAHTTPGDPHAAAVDTARSLIARAPAPRRAERVDRSPLAALDSPTEIPGAQHVQRTRLWTAPGTVAGVIADLQAHPARGLEWSGSGSSSGGAGPAIQSVEFGSGSNVTLQYSVVAYRGGVLVRADVQVLWAPRRPSYDVVPSSVRSVDVLVVRKDPQQHSGAPTVRRTLHGAAARSLADYVNRLPLPVPGAFHCPANIGGAQEIDRLVFHAGAVRAVVRVQLNGCSKATFAVGDREPVQLALTREGAKADLDQTVLAALGLPPGYGGR